MSDGEESGSATSYLDERTFYQCCKLLVQHSSVLKDGWSWIEVKGDDEGYITKTSLIPRKLSSLLNCKTEEKISTVIRDDQLDDEVVGAHTACDNQAIMRYEYHVLYSCSHQVPILYFRASTLNGQPLSLEEVWNNIHPNYRQRLLQEPWDTLTQQEHPLLGQPFFVLHPCRTREFMKPVLQMAHAEKRKVNYLVTWLSVVGPVVGLDVPLSYTTAVTSPD